MLQKFLNTFQISILIPIFGVNDRKYYTEGVSILNFSFLSVESRGQIPSETFDLDGF